MAARVYSIYLPPLILSNSSYTTCAPYTGRFAPSPSGPLHDGSLVAAMASFLDARAHHGRWLLRIEDIDTPRVAPGADQIILSQLQQLGMRWDGDIIWQSQRLSRYADIYEQLGRQGLIYGCACTRQEIASNALRAGLLGEDGERPYAGTCRAGIAAGRSPRAWRVRMPDEAYAFTDRWVGARTQNVAQAVGDMIVKRADGLFAYQLVVVVDDHDQQVTDIVRGQDLLSSTARQHQLARMLGFMPPRMMHVPLVLDADGRKLSKQNHAQAIDVHNPIKSLQRAWAALGFDVLPVNTVNDFWDAAVAAWRQRFTIR